MLWLRASRLLPLVASHWLWRVLALGFGLTSFSFQALWFEAPTGRRSQIHQTLNPNQLGVGLGAVDAVLPWSKTWQKTALLGLLALAVTVAHSYLDLGLRGGASVKWRLCKCRSQETATFSMVEDDEAYCPELGVSELLGPALYTYQDRLR